MCGAGPLQGRKGNYGDFLGGAHNREPTPPKAPTDRQEQGILQLDLSDPDETPRYSELCQ